MPHADEALGRTYSHDHTTADRTGPQTNDEHDGFSEYATSTAATPASGKVRVYAEDAGGVARLRIKHSTGSDLAVFRDAVSRVKNTSGGTITKGSAVYISGATGGFQTVAKAKADAAATMFVFGVTLADAADNAFVTVQMSGVAAGLDTSAFAVGNKLYVSPTTAGGLTTTEPEHPYLSQFVGTVLTSHVNNGQLQVAISAAHEGDDFGTNRAVYKIGPGSGTQADLQFVTGTTNTLAFPATGRSSPMRWGLSSALP
jgi:hypothetical protein